MPSLATFLLLARSPIGRAGGIALIALAALGWAYFKGVGDASARCTAAADRARIGALERDLAAAERSARLANDQARAATARQNTLNQRISDYEAQLAASGDDAQCVLTDDDARRLRELAR